MIKFTDIEIKDGYIYAVEEDVVTWIRYILNLD